MEHAFCLKKGVQGGLLSRQAALLAEEFIEPGRWKLYDEVRLDLKD
jgi:hypothetical protein